MDDISTKYSNWTVPTIAGCLISAVMAWRGYRRQSLSWTGSIAAFTVGSLSFTSEPFNPLFPTVLFTFYLCGTVATKLGSSQKLKFDGEYKLGGGQRDIWQVLSNAGLGSLLIIISNLMSSQSIQFQKSIEIAYLACYSCCLGDTLASELGVLSTETPRLIINWRQVPRGTNGGVTMMGLFASFLGGFVIAMVASIPVVSHNLSLDLIWSVCLVSGLFGSIVCCCCSCLFEVF